MDSKRWRLVLAVAVTVWLACMVRLMIADVWDETNGMLAFSSPAQTLGQKVQFVLTQSLGFWRPLPTLAVTVVLHSVRDFDVSWRVLRALNILLLLGAAWFFHRAARHPLFTIAFLFSGSAVITAGWYANVFDASALLLIAVATWLLLRENGHSKSDLAAGVLLGIAFFCKETAALALPFLLMLWAAGRITFRQALRAGIPAAILGAVYFVLRSKIVPFGGAGDVHGFVPEHYVPTLVTLAETFWLQTLKHAFPAGFLFLVLSLAALRRPRLIAAAVVFLVATSVVYWGMFVERQNGVLMHHLNFVGRLYLIPATLMLFLLALERRTIAMAALLLPILLGGATTWRDHARFQSTYARVYRTAREAKVKPLVVHYPAKPLDDVVRGIKIGDYPEAPVRIAPKGGLLPR